MIEAIAALLGIAGAMGITRDETRAAGFGAWVIGSIFSSTCG